MHQDERRSISGAKVQDEIFQLLLTTLKDYSPRQVAATLKLTTTSANRELRALLKTKQVVRYGHPNSFRYQHASIPIPEGETQQWLLWGITANG